MQSTGHTSTHAASLVPMQGSQMIYATWVSSQPGKYNSERRRHLARPKTCVPAAHALARAIAAVLGLTTGLATVYAAPVWRDAPELLPLFAPAGPRSTAYSMRVTDEGLEVVLRQLDGDPA